MGVVNVYMDVSVALEITQTASATLIDVVSNVGGTLGLFSGFSLISAIEIVYWACKGLLRPKKVAGKRKSKILRF